MQSFSDNTYKFFFKGNPAPMLLLDHQFSVLDANEAWCRLTGNSRDKSVGKSVLKVFNIELQKGIYDFLTDMSADPEQSFKSSLSTSEGNNKCVSIQKSGFFIDGQPMLLLLFTSITNSDNQLYLFKSIVEEQNDMICRYLDDTTVIYSNTAFAALFQKRPEELLGKKLAEQVSKDKHSGILESIRQLRKTKQHRTSVMEVTDAGGNSCWIEWQDKAIFKPDGEIICFQSTGRDISTIKKSELSLSKALALNEAMLNYLPDLMFRVDAEGRYLFAAASDKSKLLATEETFIGKTFNEVLPVNLAKLSYTKLHEAISSNNLVQYEYELIINGKPNYFECRLVPIDNTGALAMIRDRTREKLIENELIINEEFLRQSLDLFNKSLEIKDNSLLNRFIVEPLSKIYKADHCAVIEYKHDNQDALLSYSGKLSFNKAQQCFAEIRSVQRDEIQKQPRFFETLDFEKIVDGKEIVKCSSMITIPYGAPDKSGKMIVVVYEHPQHFSKQDNERAGIISNFLTALFYRNISRDHHREQQRQTKLILEHSPIGVMAVNHDQRYIMANFAASLLLGYTEKEIKEKTIADILPADELQHGFSKFHELMLNGQMTTEIRLKRKNNNLVWCALNAVKINDELLVAFVHDISKQKEAEEALNRNFAILHKLTDNVPGLIFSLHKKPDGSFSPVYLSKKVKQIFGLEAHEVEADAGMLFKQVNESDRDYVSETLKCSIEKLIKWECNFKLRDAQGIEKWIQLETSPPELHENGTLVWHGYLQDISQRKQIEQDLHNSREQLQNILNRIEDVIYLTSYPDNIPLFVSTSSIKLYGYTPTEFLSNPQLCTDVIHSDDASNVQKQSEELLLHSYVEKQYRIIHADGTTKWVLDRCWVIRNESGIITHLQGIVTDFTQSRAMERELVFKSRFQEILMDLAAKLINLPLSDTDPAINHALEQMGVFFQADRSYLFTHNNINNTISNTHEWCKTGVSPQIGNLQEVSLHELEALKEHFYAGKTLHISNINQMEPDDPFRQMLDPQEIKSLIIVPMKHEDKLLGLIGFDSVFNYKNWTENEQQMLKFAAQLLVNIIERKNYERNLLLSENQLRMATEASGTAIWVWDVHRDSITHSPMIRQVSRDENLDLTLSFDQYMAKVHPHDRKRLKMSMQQTIKDPNHVLDEIYRIKNHAHEDIWVRDIGRAVGSKNEHGTVIITGIIQDVTEKRRMEMKLQESELQLRTFYENAAVGLYRTDDKGIIKLANPALALLLGYEDAEELLGKNIISDLLVDPTIRRSFIGRLKRKNSVRGMETLWFTKTQKPVYVRESASAITNSNGDVLFIDGSIEDVTESRKTLQALAVSEERFRLLAKNLNEIIWITDPTDQQVTFINQAYEDVFELKASDLIMDRNDYKKIILEEDLKKLEADYMDFHLNRDKVELNYRILTPQNKLKYIKIKVSKVFDNTGNLKANVGIATDITMIKQEEEKLQKMLLLERQLSELKSKFIYSASHEFRTPLATISATAETLLVYRDKMTDEVVDTRLEKIMNQVKHLRRNIEDLLNLALLKGEKNKFEPVTADLAHFLEDVCMQMMSLPDFHHELITDIPQNPVYYTFDTSLMHRVITNLISNASKYSDAGEPINFVMKTTEDHIVITTKDKGIGIPAEELKNIGTPFYRGSNAGKFYGSGLGLTIIKEAVDMHQGTIDIDSEVNQGTTITIRLPLTERKNKNHT